jgi:DNA-binding response OmpR family regulator
MLELLWRCRGNVVPRDGFEAVVESRSTNFDALLKVLICHLRDKLRGTPLQIEAVYGHGYRLVVSATPAAAPAAAA